MYSRYRFHYINHDIVVLSTIQTRHAHYHFERTTVMNSISVPPGTSFTLAVEPEIDLPQLGNHWPDQRPALPRLRFATACQKAPKNARVWDVVGRTDHRRFEGERCNAGGTGVAAVEAQEASTTRYQEGDAVLPGWPRTAANVAR
jgi:hypothetical protein